MELRKATFEFDGESSVEFCGDKIRVTWNEDSETFDNPPLCEPSDCHETLGRVLSPTYEHAVAMYRRYLKQRDHD